jgi:hypothetical protein
VGWIEAGLHLRLTPPGKDSDSGSASYTVTAWFHTAKTQTFGTVDIAPAGIVATERPFTLVAEVMPFSLITPWRLAEKTTDAVKRGVPIDNDNENLAQMTLRKFAPRLLAES